MSRPDFWARFANHVGSFEMGAQEFEFRGYLTARNLVLEGADRQINHQLSIWARRAVVALGTARATRLVAVSLRTELVRHQEVLGWS